MGARAGYWLAKLAPERLTSLMTIGGPVRPPTGLIAERIADFERGPAALADRYAGETSELPVSVREQILENDTRPYITIVQARQFEDSVEDALPSIDLPVLVYSGEDDVVYEETKLAARLIPGATYISVPGLDHNQSFYRSDVALPHIRAFLAGVGSGSPT
jgi:pimeloyl-ACP methyl ester carboxylesterase